MTFKGSIVIKRTDLLSLIQDHKFIFRAPKVDEGAKWCALGGQWAYENVLWDNVEGIDWDEFMQDTFAINPAHMRDGVNYIFSELP